MSRDDPSMLITGIDRPLNLLPGDETFVINISGRAYGCY
jgi:hypothetical protein